MPGSVRSSSTRSGRALMMSSTTWSNVRRSQGLESLALEHLDDLVADGSIVFHHEYARHIAAAPPFVASGRRSRSARTFPCSPIMPVRRAGPRAEGLTFRQCKGRPRRRGRNAWGRRRSRWAQGLLEELGRPRGEELRQIAPRTRSIALGHDAVLIRISRSATAPVPAADRTSSRVAPSSNARTTSTPRVAASCSTSVAVPHRSSPGAAASSNRPYCGDAQQLRGDPRGDGLHARLTGSGGKGRTGRCRRATRTAPRFVGHRRLHRSRA